MAINFPWRMVHRGGVVNTCFIAPFRRLWLRNRLGRETGFSKGEITVVIPVRNRGDHRLRNALSSLRAQDYPKELLKICVVDYGSSSASLSKIELLCFQFDCQLIRIDASGVWNKSKCANYAIKRCVSEFVLSADADNIFSKNFVREAVSVLNQDRLSVVYSQMLDLEEGILPALLAFSENNVEVPYGQLEAHGVARGAGLKHPGTFVTATLFFHVIHGYDENYEEWGWEDNDVMHRFYMLGLNLVSISDRARFLHQWHPKGEGVRDWTESKDRNRAYFEKNFSIVKRNLEGWGEG